MSIITVLKSRAQLIVIQILETLLWLSFIIMSNVPEVKAAPVVFEDSMNMRVCSCNFQLCKWNTFIRKIRPQEGRQRENLILVY